MEKLISKLEELQYQLTKLIHATETLDKSKMNDEALKELYNIQFNNYKLVEDMVEMIHKAALLSTKQVSIMFEEVSKN